MLTVHDYTFELTSQHWPSHAQPTVERIMVAMALEILHLDKTAARKLHTQATTRAAMERRAMAQAQEAVAKLPPPKSSLTEPKNKSCVRVKKKTKPKPAPVAREVTPTIKVFAR